MAEQHNDDLTWALLLAHWMEFARGSVSLPESGDAGRFRRSTAPLISLAAVTHALGELDRLDDDERALAVDKAEILIRSDIATLDQIWEGEDPPEAVWVFVENAAAALGEATGIDPDADPDAGPDADEDHDGIDRVAWFAASDGKSWDHPAALLSALAKLSPTLEAWVPSPGVPFFDGGVVCHLEDASGLRDEALGLVASFLGDGVEGPVEVDERYQVFRQFNFLKGGAERDVLAPEALHEAVPGQPLLVKGLSARPGSSEAEIEPVPMPPKSAPPMEPLQVFEAVPEDDQEGDDSDGE